MMKIVGSLMLLCGCTGIGLQQVKKMDKRVRTIQSMICGLEVMERELSFRVPLLEEILLAAVRSTEGVTRDFFSFCREELSKNQDKPFVEIWNSAVREQLIYLKESDLDAILALGDILGRYDCEGQQLAIGRAHSALEQVLSSALAERSSRGKVYRVLSTTVGALLVILLL